MDNKTESPAETAVESTVSAQEILKELHEIMGVSEGQDIRDRAKHFMNKEKFIPVESLILGTMKTDKGIAVFIGECIRQDLEISLSRLNFRVYEAMRFIEMKSAMEKKKSDIILPK